MGSRFEDDYDLSTSDVSFYRENGYVHLRNVLAGTELQHFASAIDENMKKHWEKRPLSERSTYGKAFLQMCNLWQRDERVAALVTAKRFAKIAADLLGVDGVRVYHDQALFKEPGGGITPWHQDQYYWPLRGVKTVTIWMPLEDATDEMGTMRFAAGSHLHGDLNGPEISDASQEYFTGLVAERQFPVKHVGAMKAGDATFHDGYVVHGALGNGSSTAVRKAITVIYMEDGGRISEPDNPNREGDLSGWLPGLKPGDLAASAINPLVFSRRVAVGH